MKMSGVLRRGALGAVIMLPVLAGSVAAHHGWGWTSDEPFELTGTVEDIYMGQPHPTLTVNAADGTWQVDLAPLQRTRAAGFDESVAGPGDEVTAYGYRSLDQTEQRMKAARIVVGGEAYDVYPNRAQAF